jgi:ferric-dicitrate binding protein FerR (iron transport regulator)
MAESQVISLTIEFIDPNMDEDRQEGLTQALYRDMRDLPGVRVDRVTDTTEDAKRRSAGAFLWGLLQAKVGLDGVKNLFGFLGDRLGNKPIKIKVKLADGREIEIEASSRAELVAAEETIDRLSKK